jgi:hypothetical protein
VYPLIFWTGSGGCGVMQSEKLQGSTILIQKVLTSYFATTESFHSSIDNLHWPIMVPVENIWKPVSVIIWEMMEILRTLFVVKNDLLLHPVNLAFYDHLFDNQLSISSGPDLHLSLLIPE